MLEASQCRGKSTVLMIHSLGPLLFRPIETSHDQFLKERQTDRRK